MNILKSLLESALQDLRKQREDFENSPEVQALKSDHIFLNKIKPPMIISFLYYAPLLRKDGPTCGYRIADGKLSRHRLITGSRAYEWNISGKGVDITTSASDSNGLKILIKAMVDDSKKIDKQLLANDKGIFKGLSDEAQEKIIKAVISKK